MSRSGEQGLVRGCCLGLILLIAVAVATGIGAVAALSQPDMGPAPTGVRHGGSPETMAVALAAEIGRGLLTAPHTVVQLSERDLTVIARARNPQPGRFRDPQARIRDGLVAISATGSAGPLDVVTIAHVRVLLTSVSGQPHLTAEMVGLEVGRLPVPDWARALIDNRGAGALSIDSVMDASPALTLLRANLDCVGTVPGGVRLGIHRPGEAADNAGCAGL